MKSVCMGIRKDPCSKIMVVVGQPDDLCLKCPYLDGRDCVQSDEIGRWVKSQDEKVLKYLGLKKGSVHQARDVFNRSFERINSDTIESVCSGCIFLDNCVKVGVNKSFYNDLNKT